MAHAIPLLKHMRGSGATAAAPDQSVTGRAMRLALVRGFEDAAKLPASVADLQQSRRSLGETIELLPENPLIAMLEGPGETLGVMALGPGVLAAAVERQTLGRITAAEPVARRPTRTDAALVADLIERILREFEAPLAGDPALTWAGGFRYASFLDDARPLGFLLEETTYRVFQSHVILGGGAKSGAVLLALPAEGRAGGGTGSGTAADRAAAKSWADDLRLAVFGAQVRLDAVLCRVNLPLSSILALKPGDVIPMPVTALDRIVLQGGDGVRMAEGRLGQHRGLRALRLNEGPQAVVQVLQSASSGSGASPG